MKKLKLNRVALRPLETVDLSEARGGMQIWPLAEAPRAPADQVDLDSLGGGKSETR